MTCWTLLSQYIELPLVAKRSNGGRSTNGHQYLESRTHQQIDTRWENRATVCVKIVIDYPEGETLMLAVSLRRLLHLKPSLPELALGSMMLYIGWCSVLINST